jgi:uncharacterized membrane protein YfcA
MTPTEIVLLLILGSGTGFLAGLLGIGGGLLLTPFLIALLTAHHFPVQHVVHVAIATSLATILFTSVSSVRAHARRDAVLWPVVLTLGPGILLGSLAGAQIAGLLPATALALAFALFVTFSATQMLRDRKPAPHRELPGAPGMFGVGTGIGVLSSIVGAGGGFVSVPFMLWCNVPMPKAVGTSAALGFPIAAAGTVGYILAGLRVPGLPAGTLGYIYWPALFTVAAASMLTAPLGARVAHRLDRKMANRIFAGLLYAVAGYMLYKASRVA